MKRNLICLLLLLSGITDWNHAQSAKAPVPTPISSAHRVFLGNGGADIAAGEIFKSFGHDPEPYTSVYAALKSWEHFEMLNSPEGADLVMEVRSTAIEVGAGKQQHSAPQLELRVLDGRSKTLLWTLSEPVETAFLVATWRKNYAKAVGNMVEELKALTAEASH